jgi:hypothetical protein
VSSPGHPDRARQLLSNHKERLVIAGLGVDRLIGGPASAFGIAMAPRRAYRHPIGVRHA